MRPFAVFASAVMLAASMSLAVVAGESASSKPAKVHTASGTLESYDATARTLTVRGSKATWTFDVSDARVWDGSKSVGLEDIAARAGAKVTVKYTDTEGKKSATSVRLAAAHGGKPGSKSE